MTSSLLYNKKHKLGIHKFIIRLISIHWIRHKKWYSDLFLLIFLRIKLYSFDNGVIDWCDAFRMRKEASCIMHASCSFPLALKLKTKLISKKNL